MKELTKIINDVKKSVDESDIGPIFTNVIDDDLMNRKQLNQPAFQVFMIILSEYIKISLTKPAVGQKQ